MENQVQAPERPSGVPGNGKHDATEGGGTSTHVNTAYLESLKSHYEHDYNTLFKHAVSIVHSREVADDIVQDAYTRTIAAMQAGTKIEHLGAWLNRCVRNLAFEHVGNKKSLPLVEDLDTVEKSSLAEITYNKQGFEKVFQAARRLSPDQRSTFVLSVLKGMDYDEIAIDQGRGLEAVRQLLFRARRNIREAVSPDSFFAATLARPVHVLVKEGRALRDQIAAKLSNVQASVTTFAQSSAEAISQPSTALVAGTAVIVAISTPTLIADNKAPDPVIENGTPPAVVVSPTSPKPAPTPTETKDAKPPGKGPVKSEPPPPAIAPIGVDEPNGIVPDRPSTAPRGRNRTPGADADNTDTSDVVDTPSNDQPPVDTGSELTTPSFGGGGGSGSGDSGSSSGSSGGGGGSGDSGSSSGSSGGGGGGGDAVPTDPADGGGSGGGGSSGGSSGGGGGSSGGSSGGGGGGG